MFCGRDGPLQAQQWPESGIEEGLAVFSRTPILDSTVAQLPMAGVPEGQGDLNHRICVRALLKKRGISFDFFVTHFSYDAREQPANAQGVMEFTGRFGAPQARGGGGRRLRLPS